MQSGQPLSEEAATAMARFMASQGMTPGKIFVELTNQGVDRGIANFIVHQRLGSSTGSGHKSRYGQPHKVMMALVCLHISTALYLMLGIGTFCLFVFVEEARRQSGPVFPVFMLVFSLAIAAGVEFVAYGLRKRKFWAWVAGLCIFGTYAPSAFFPLGILGLIALLDRGTRIEFEV